MNEALWPPIISRHYLSELQGMEKLGNRLSRMRFSHKSYMQLFYFKESFSLFRDLLRLSERFAFIMPCQSVTCLIPTQSPCPFVTPFSAPFACTLVQGSLRVFDLEGLAGARELHLRWADGDVLCANDGGHAAVDAVEGAGCAAFGADGCNARSVI